MAQYDAYQAEPMDTGDNWRTVKPKQSHFNDVEEHIPVYMDQYFIELGLEIRDIEKVKIGTDPEVNGEEAAKNVFIQWRKSNGRAANLQALVDGFTKCEFHAARTNLTSVWEQAGRESTDKLEDKDIYPIIREFTPNQLLQLFSKGLEIPNRDIEMCRGAGADTSRKIMRLLNFWQQRTNGTLGDLLKGFENINPSAVETLSDKWRQMSTL